MLKYLPVNLQNLPLLALLFDTMQRVINFSVFTGLMLSLAILLTRIEHRLFFIPESSAIKEKNFFREICLELVQILKIMTSNSAGKLTAYFKFLLGLSIINLALFNQSVIGVDFKYPHLTSVIVIFLFLVSGLNGAVKGIRHFHLTLAYTNLVLGLVLQIIIITSVGVVAKGVTVGDILTGQVPTLHPSFLKWNCCKFPIGSMTFIANFILVLILMQQFDFFIESLSLNDIDQQSQKLLSFIKNLSVLNLGAVIVVLFLGGGLPLIGHHEPMGASWAGLIWFLVKIMAIVAGLFIFKTKIPVLNERQILHFIFYFLFPTFIIINILSIINYV